MTTTEGRLYFINVDTLEKLEIQFVPEELSDMRTADLAPVKIVARNIPKYHHIGGDRRVSLELDFHASEENRRDVMRKVSWLKELTYNDKGKKPPANVKLVFGEMFKDEVWVVAAVVPRYSQFDKAYGFLPRQAYVRIDLLEDIPANVGLNDIRWT